MPPRGRNPLLDRINFVRLYLSEIKATEQKDRHAVKVDVSLYDSERMHTEILKATA